MALMRSFLRGAPLWMHQNVIISVRPETVRLGIRYIVTDARVPRADSRFHRHLRCDAAAGLRTAAHALFHAAVSFERFRDGS